MATKVVGLSGPAGSGKSEAANHLVTRFGFTPVKFAKPLKDMLRQLYRTLGVEPEEIERRIEGDLKETPDPYLNGRTPRHAMETLGTEWGRICMGADFWINTWAKTVKATKGPVVVDDCRFNNEAEAITSMGGETIRLTPKVRRRKTSQHVAERGVSDNLITAEIVNDGTVQDLLDKVERASFPDAEVTFGPLDE